MEAVVPWDFLPGSLNPAQNTKRSRVSGAHQLFNEMPTSTLAEEILTPGEGQIKALLVIGGNPMASIPDPDQTKRAIEALDLCVVVDGRLSETAQLADYFLPSSYGLEKLDMTVFNDIFWGKPFHQVTQAVVDAPADATHEYRYLMELAKRLDTTMSFSGVDIDTATPPEELDLLAMIFAEGTTKVPVRDIASHEAGHIYKQFEAIEVIPAMEGMEDRLRFMPDGVPEEFAQLKTSVSTQDDQYLLICRRNPHVYNSMCHEFPQAPNDNPAWMHSDDIAKEGMQSGDTVKITSAHGEISATLLADDTLRRGVLAITHGFGGKSGGVAVGKLMTTKESTDRYVRIPQMSALPVSIKLAS